MRKNAIEILKAYEEQYIDVSFSLKSGHFSTIDAGTFVFAEYRGIKAEVGRYMDGMKLYIKSFMTAVDSYRNKDNLFSVMKTRYEKAEFYNYHQYSVKSYLNDFLGYDNDMKNGAPPLSLYRCAISKEPEISTVSKDIKHPNKTIHSI